MIKFLLSLFKPFRWFIERMGADYYQFISILELKLTIDNRRTKSLKNNSKDAMENALIKQAFGQIVLGSFMAISLYMVKSAFTYYYLMHIILMVMMGMMIISEFTTILFDTSENVIIQPLPIKGNTMNLARNAHVFLYLTMMAFSISVISVVVSIIKFGILSGLIFTASILLNVLFTLFLANLLYLGIMRFATGEQLKNVLMYFQIIIAIVFMAGYQFGLNVVDKSQLQNMTLHIDWYTFLIPAAVFSGLVESFSFGVFDWQHILFIVEAITLPIVATFITGRYLTPVFNRKLMDLEQGDRATKVKSTNGRKSMWYNILSFTFVHREDEKASFLLGWKMTGSERLFKQTFFPSLGYVLIMIAVQFTKRSFDMTEMAASSRYLILLYSFIIISFSLSNALLNGNNQHAHWIFKTLPVESPAVYFKGFIKAAFARFFIPFYIGLSVGVCFIWGIKVLPDVIIALLAIYLFTLLYYYLQQPIFPFAQPKLASQGGAVFMKMMGLILLATALGFAHYFLIKWNVYGSIVLLALYIAAILYANRVFVHKTITWESVDKANSYL